NAVSRGRQRQGRSGRDGGFRARGSASSGRRTASVRRWSLRGEDDALAADLALLLEPRHRIHGRRPAIRAAMTDLEMQMWPELGIREADAADHLSLRHILLLADVSARQ